MDPGNKDMEQALLVQQVPDTVEVMLALEDMVVAALVPEDTVMATLVLEDMVMATPALEDMASVHKDKAAALKSVVPEYREGVIPP
jgi:hypothetical protein